ncbi:MAG: tryptophan--tRNA ligase [Patescibacteria group bacterium]
MKKDAKILVSGIKPTGRPHIGNYFGAMKQYVDLQDSYNSFVFIADLHALTTIQNGKELSENTLNIAIDYLAIGLDPRKTIIFKQSDIPEVAELGWIFNCITTMPYLMRAHAFKDAEAKNKEINVGVFDYPLLMAADILAQDADIVPVGQDQKQHVEIARDTAEKFNKIFGDTFKLPEPLILPNVQTVAGTDGRKMSKSYGNTIELFASDEEIKKAVMSIATDSKGVNEPKDPEDSSLFNLHKLFMSKGKLDELQGRYLEGGIGYKESKEILIDDIISFARPFREKRDKLAQDKKAIVAILEQGRDVVRKRVGNKMEDVRRKIGTKFY